MVPSYSGKSPYLLMTKYNNYLEGGGNGLNKIAVLDPDATETDPVTGASVMREVLTIAGVTPDGAPPASERVVHQFRGRRPSYQIHSGWKRGRETVPLGSGHEHVLSESSS